ncbi:hypothetical protein GL263_18800 [Streptomyces durbertensis]|uniref:Integral membrane protein n=1 Tax=Streptomyces durbertensis TaxID=2448886 RepID=A0ABR6EJU4_9ACTN|nr:DUF6480 family protein [Streptomyces durbertensis]MBB1245591.1 hypothetical protein [Streptomyces durbertensis]
MDAQNQDPDPKKAAGRDVGGGPPPGETPPGEGGLSGAGPRETHNPTKGWSVAPLTALLVVVALFVAFFLTYAIWIAVGGIG